ncbi:M42 family metallopeptidase [Peptoniphilaceae bacterium SGI.097]
MDPKFIQRIQDLSNAAGASGFEKPVSNLIQQEWKSFGKSLIDKMNNVYLLRNKNSQTMDSPVSPLTTDLPEEASGRKLRLQLDAHLDEVGFVVQAILPNGTLRILPLGGMVSHNFAAQKVRVHINEETSLPGIIASKSPHFLSAEEKKQGISMENLIVDIGASSAEEARRLGVSLCLPVLPDVTCTFDESRALFMGKAFDCRSGCASLLETMIRLDQKDLAIDVFGTLSAQEEVGERGAVVTANRVRPDLAIVFEGCPADDTFSTPSGPQTVLRKGPMLRHLDTSMITHPGFQHYALRLAKKLGIPAQEAVRSGGGTDGGIIHTSAMGVPTIVIGIPVRYIHAPIGFSTCEDHENAVRLACAIIENMNQETYDTL